MEKEIKYVAPEAQILSAQVERGYQSYSAGGNIGEPDEL